MTDLNILVERLPDDDAADLALWKAGADGARALVAAHDSKRPGNALGAVLDHEDSHLEIADAGPLHALLRSAERGEPERQ